MSVEEELVRRTCVYIREEEQQDENEKEEQENEEQQVGEEELEMRKFYQHLIKHSQAKVVTVFSTGSSSETPGQDLVLKQYKLNVGEFSDQDLMHYKDDKLAFSWGRTAPEHFSGNVIRIYSAGHHAGYTKLGCENSNIEYTDNYTDNILNFVTVRHGPAINYRTERLIFELFGKWNFPIAGEFIKTITSHAIQTTDDVSAVHCPFWPKEANEWIMRTRASGFPSKSTIKKVIRYGCDFVQVSHKLSVDSNEWRFSFSKAELILIHSWTTSQRVVYRTLHMFNKKKGSTMDNSVLSSYYFKTLMLFAIEEKPAEFWSEDVLLYSICKLLSSLSQWLRAKCCPNYFIPTNNMIDHLTNTELVADIYALCQLLDLTGIMIDVLHNSRDIEIDVANRTYRIEAPMWLYTSLVISEQINASKRRDTQRFAQCFPTLLCKAFSFEFSDVYYRIKCCSKAKSNLIPFKGDNVLHSFSGQICGSSNILLKSPNIPFYSRHCSATVPGCMLGKWFIKYEPDSCSIPTSKITDNNLNALNLDNMDKYQKCLLFSRSTSDICITTNASPFSEHICCKNEVSIVLHATTTIDYKTYTAIEFYKELPGMSPTVSISWFINSAYLANIYYTILCNCGATEEMCDNIIHAYKQSVFNQTFAERSLPLILSTEWASVYDEELQVMLGFFSLCSFMFNKTDHNRSVCLGVCPVLFAWYLKCHCAGDQMHTEKWGKCIDDTGVHIQTCQADKKVCNGRTAINLTLQIITLKVIEKATVNL